MAEKQEAATTTDKQKRCLGVYIAKELYAELAETAKKKEVSMTFIVKEALKAYLEKQGGR